MRKVEIVAKKTFCPVCGTPATVYEVEGMDVGYLRCTHEGCGAGSMCSIETFRRLVREDLAKHGMEIEIAKPDCLAR